MLAEKNQFDAIVLGDRPVSIIKGDAPGEYRKYLEKAIAAVRGTGNQRKLISDYSDNPDEM